MPDSDTSGLLTIEEASHLLRLRPSTLRAWVLKRQIPFCKLGRLVRLRRSDVEDFISNSLIPARPEHGNANHK